MTPLCCVWLVWGGIILVPETVTCMFSSVSTDDSRYLSESSFWEQHVRLFWGAMVKLKFLCMRDNARPHVQTLRRMPFIRWMIPKQLYNLGNRMPIEMSSSSLSEEDALEYDMVEDLEDSPAVISPPLLQT
ncbi:hypothetical protein AVEN_188342-1 [Araneus ventricosus]|uniref:Uncharacterized protein n=1 Tax=Araneus ventricosus TaxID=182803 RepID=A0A4Y2VFY0_ARAVE|nr:hypothetical protein AVEN_188342-1 [Araneus ventricosus]